VGPAKLLRAGARRTPVLLAPVIVTSSSSSTAENQGDSPRPQRVPGTWRRIWTTLLAGAVFLAVTLSLLWVLLAWAIHDARQAATDNLSAKNLKMLYVALSYYEHEHGSLLPAIMTDSTGHPVQSWRVLLFPQLNENSLYARIDLDEPWDSPANRALLEMAPEIYRSPREVKTNETIASYFAVVGPHAPWWSTNGKKPSEWGSSDPALVIELTGLDTPWMEPRDMTIEQVLDILRSDVGKGARGGEPSDIMYLSVSGEVRKVKRNVDRETLRKHLLGEGMRREYQ
jgi:hypothetical protein